jgi:aryl-alcohol dehydrogenase-like predicted oxidoreductase
MEFRHLGRSGLKVSEITFGNWVTHGVQVDDRTAHATIHAALDSGVTTFDTADAYAGTRAEAVMGEALKDQRREGLEILTKVYWPTGPGMNDRGLSRKHIVESCNASLKRLQTDYVDLYQAHRFDYETPLEETLRAFDDLVRQGKVLYVGVSEWNAEQIRAAARIADDMGLDRIVSNQPQYSMLWRVIEPEVVPASVELGIGQIVFSPIAQGVLTGKYSARGQSRRIRGRTRGHDREVDARRRALARAGSAAHRLGSRADTRSARHRMGPRQSQRLVRHRRRVTS